MNLIGTSFDIHQLSQGKGIFLGGIFIKCNYKAIARSDGDVLLHALSEAIFSALGLEDLGTYFPESAPETEDMDSSIILDFAIKKMKERNFKIQNLTVHILLQNPKLSPFKEEIKENISSLTNLSKQFITVHAGTTESLGSIGNNKAIGCFASVLLTDQAA